MELAVGQQVDATVTDREHRPTLEGNNTVNFPSGLKIEVFGGRILISAPNQNATLELIKRSTEDACDSDGTPGFWEVYWPYSPAWSDGKPITQHEMVDLARQVKVAAATLGDKIRQFFKDETLVITDPYEFNTF